MKKLPNTIKILKKSVHKYEGEEGKYDTRPTESIKPDIEVDNPINSLTDKDISDLRELWAKYFDQEIPKWNKGYLTKRLAYRIQEVHYATALRPKVKSCWRTFTKGAIKS